MSEQEKPKLSNISRVISQQLQRPHQLKYCK